MIDSTALLIWFDDSTYLILESEERTVFAVPFVQSFRQETVAPVLALSTSSNRISVPVVTLRAENIHTMLLLLLSFNNTSNRY